MMLPEATAVAQQTTPDYGNLTSAASGFGDSGALVALILIIALAVVGLMSSVRAYQWALAASGRFVATLEYALKGVVTAVALAVVAAPLYLLYHIGPSGRRTVGVAFAGLLIAYGVLVILGVIGEAAWGRIVAHHEAATGRHPLDRFRGEESEVSD